MPRYQALTPDAFAHLRCARTAHYRHAATSVLTPLALVEVFKACMVLPLAFVQQGAAGQEPAPARYSLAALQGLQPGVNLCVAPSDGRWLAPYVPARHRCQPFALAHAQHDRVVLCVDADSPLLGQQGEALFDAQGQPSAYVRQMLGFVEQLHAGQQRLDALCAVLAGEGLIAPWPLSVQHAGGEQTLEGLHCIDEARLQQLDAPALARIRDAGALPVVYAQLLSMQHVQALSALAAQRAGQSSGNGADRSMDMRFSVQGDTLKF